MEKKKILIIEDDEDLLEVLQVRLSSQGYEVHTNIGKREVLREIRSIWPDLILLDITLPEISGLEIKAELNKNTHTASIPVIFLTGKDSVSDKVKGLGLGADDYIAKPFDSKELMSRIEAALRRRGFYEEISMTDGLTGVYNVKFFQKQITLFFNIAKRYKKIFALIIIDIDNLKDINDTYGHLAGDFILKEFSSLTKKTLRKSDILARYGGDEFAIIMPETDEEHAAYAIDRLKQNINGKPFVFGDKKQELRFNISVGMTTYRDTLTSELEMFGEADKKLYRDKHKASK
ncbi:MAG: diguanylate cyclase [Candidatus Omnitrophica bacterium]|nr:diguanylate cyclase [Candidatus Omnitrophota bacterium]